MAIEEFGQSLLAQQRQRNEQRRKEAERNQLQGLLLKVGLTVGNKLLANKTKRFMNSTEVKSASRVARATDTLMADNMRIWDAIDASGKDPLQYLIEQNKPIAEQEINSFTAFKDRGTQNYEGTIYKTAKQMAQEQLAALNKMRAIRMNNTLGKEEQRVMALARDLRPSTVQDAIVGRLTGLFEGFTGQDADENELLSFEEYINDQDPASRGYLLKKYQALGEEYRRSGDLKKANQTARDIMSNRSDPKLGRELIETEDFITAGEKVIRIKVKTTYDIGSEGKRTQFGQPSREIMRGENGEPLELDLSTEKERVTANMKSFNWSDFAEKNLIGNATSQIFSSLRDAGISTLDEIDTDEEYKTFTKIFMDVASSASNYKLGEAGKVFFDNGIKWWHEDSGDGTKLLSKIKAAEGRGEDTTEMRKEYDRAFADYARNLREEAVKLPQANRPQGLESPASAVSAPTRAVPTLEEFLEAAKARPENKGISEQALKDYYFQTYGMR